MSRGIEEKKNINVPKKINDHTVKFNYRGTFQTKK